MKLKTPDLFFSPRVLILKDEATKTEQFEVYYVFHTETKDLLYIGSGKKDRHKHVFSGASQNISLNTCTICSVPMTIVVKGIASKEESLEIEATEIKKLNPKFNGRFSEILNLSEIDVEDLGETLGIFLSRKEPTLKTLCNMYEKSPEDLKDKYEEWYQIIDKVGVEVCKSYSYKKLDIKKLYKAATSIESETVDSQIVSLFKVGQWYSSKYIKSVLESLELDKPKATLLKQWFEIESRNMKHQAGYVIIRKL